MVKYSKEIYRLTSLIPKGKVTTYKIIAQKLKVNPRLVGHILHLNKNPDKILCHRVVYSNGKLAKNFAFGGEKMQKQLLIKEGVLFLKNGRVDLKKCLFQLINI